MSCSSARFTSVIEKYERKKDIIKKDTVFVCGYSRKNWIRYAHHLLEGIIKIFGTKIIKVRCLDNRKNKSESYQLVYKNGLNIYLHFNEKMYLPIYFSCCRKNAKPLYVPYEDYFYSIKKMMNNFEKMVRNNKLVIPTNYMIDLTKIVIAGDLSKKITLNSIHLKL